MLAIKLQRIGKKHQPSYRFVVAPKKSKMAAPPVEDLGAYNPFTKAAHLNKERALHWIKMGAQPTTTVHNLLVNQGVISGTKLPIKMKKAVPKAEATPVAEAAVPAAEAPAEEEVVQEDKAPVAEEPKAEMPVAEAAPDKPELPETPSA